MKTNIKMRVTPEQSKKVQEIVFAKNDEYEYIDYQIEFIWIEPDLTVSYSYDESFYVEERSEEVDANLFISTNGTCEEEPQTRTFSTKKELAEALLRGEKWSPSIEGFAYNHQFAKYNERIDGNPFRYGDNSSGFRTLIVHWHYCDGKTLWTRVND